MLLRLRQLSLTMIFLTGGHALPRTAFIDRVFVSGGFVTVAFALRSGAISDWGLIAGFGVAMAIVLANPVALVGHKCFGELVLDGIVCCAMALILQSPAGSVMSVLLGAPIGLAFMNHRRRGRWFELQRLGWFLDLTMQFAVSAGAAATAVASLSLSTSVDAVVVAAVAEAVAFAVIVVWRAPRQLLLGAGIRSTTAMWGPSVITVPVAALGGAVAWAAARSGALLLVACLVCLTFFLQLGRQRMRAAGDRSRLERLYEAANITSTATTPEQVLAALEAAITATHPRSAHATLTVKGESVEIVPPAATAMHDPVARDFLDAVRSLGTAAMERLRLVNELERRALHDPLTGLPNRALLVDHLRATHATARRSGDPYSVVYVDLDHFKRVNDAFDHDVGDQVLVAAATRLSDLVRTEDVVARLGGEEFCIVFADDAAPDIADRVVAAFRHPLVHVHELALTVTASVGWSVLGEDQQPWDVVHRADIAAKTAKEAGRDRVMPQTAVRSVAGNRC